MCSPSRSVVPTCLLASPAVQIDISGQERVNEVVGRDDVGLIGVTGRLMVWYVGDRGACESLGIWLGTTEMIVGRLMCKAAYRIDAQLSRLETGGSVKS